MDVGEAAMTQNLESVSVNRDISLIATGKLVMVLKKSFYVISSMKLIHFYRHFEIRISLMIILLRDFLF